MIGHERCISQDLGHQYDGVSPLSLAWPHKPRGSPVGVNTRKYCSRTQTTLSTTLNRGGLGTRSVNTRADGRGSCNHCVMYITLNLMFDARLGGGSEVTLIIHDVFFVLKLCPVSSENGAHQRQT